MARTVGKDTMTLNAYFPRKYYAKLKRIAKAQQRSVSQLITDTLIIVHQLDHELITDEETNTKFIIDKEVQY